MKKFLTSASLFLFLSTNAFASNYVRKFDITKDFSNGYSTTLDIDYRNNKDRLFRRHYDVSLGKKFENGIKIEGKFRHIYLKQDGSWKLAEKRPQFQISKKFEGEYVVFEPRVRHDYQIFDGDDLNRTRLRLRLISAKEFFHIKPLISNEFYYAINSRRYNQNRFEIGAILPEIYHLTPSIFFREDSRYNNAEQKWHADQIAVFRVDLKF